MSNTNVDRFLRDSPSIVCNSKNSPFQDSYHGQIVTDDLRIIKDNKLRKDFLKGPKYYKPEKIDFDQAREVLLMVLKIFSIEPKKWSTRCCFTKIQK